MADLIAIAAHRKTSYDHPATHLLIQPPSEYTPRFAAPRGIGSSAPIPAVRMTTGSARVDPKPTLTAAGHGSLTALTLTAMGRLPKVLPAIR
jgi:hypothetical protein